MRVDKFEKNTNQIFQQRMQQNNERKTHKNKNIK